ncbi:MAG: epoxyqueuosine reductase, partial [Planctomycetales bacterium]
MSPSPLAPGELTARIKQEALRLGFARASVADAVDSPGIQRFHERLDSGCAGEMRYLPDRREAYAHPDSVLDGVQS